MTNEEDAHASSILAAAIHVVGEYGYGPASLQDIADRAGVTGESIERQFPSKSMLMSEAAAWIFGDLALCLGTRMDSEPEGLPKIQAYIRSMIAYFVANPRYFHALAETMGSGELVGPPADRPKTRRWQGVADVLAEGQRQGVLGSFDTRAVAIVIGGGIDGLLAEWTDDPSFDISAAAEELANLVSSLSVGAVFAHNATML